MLRVRDVRAPSVTMFRSTTKSDVRSQDYLRASAHKVFNSSASILCDDVYSTTYEMRLPRMSCTVLSHVTLALTGNNSRANPHRRTVHTVFRMSINSDAILRLMFIQPEVVTATIHLEPQYLDLATKSRDSFVSMENHMAPGRMRTIKSGTVELSGRLAPYVVESVMGPVEHKWEYCNVTRSRFIFLHTDDTSQVPKSLTRDSIDIMSGFKPEGCSFVKSNNLRSYTINVSTPASENSSSVGKNSCLVVYFDGSFRMCGKPASAYNVCKVFRDSLMAVLASPMSGRFVSSLAPI